MDGYTSEFSLLRQRCLDDEPIFCVAPSPSNSDDIICPGSDYETDEAIRATKQRRYEKHGRRYLQGRPLRILSASLRGPFDQASGWQNPWLPKLSTHNRQCLEDSSLPPVSSSVSQRESNVVVNRPSSEPSSTDQDPSDSMECHLPSPQSYEDLQFAEAPPNIESRSRIASWARDVEDGFLEVDQFWAPDHVSATRNVETAKRHPADRDWLKRRPAKKRKPNASQSTEPISTPTPLPTTRPRPKCKKESIIGSKSVNRSFEMTTPSSSPGKGSRGSPGSLERPAAVSSTTPTNDSQVSSQPTLQCEQKEGEIKGKEKEHEGNHIEQRYENREARSIAVSEVCPGQLQGQTSGSDEETEQPIEFQDCADESFCYQARYLRQATPPGALNAKAAHSPSPHIQTEMSTSSQHNDAVTMLSSLNTQKSSPHASCNHPETNDAEHVEKQTGPCIAATLTDEPKYPIAAAQETNLDIPQCHGGIFENCGIVDMKRDTNCTSKINAGQPLSDITSGRRASRLNELSTIPQTVLEVKEVSIMNVECSFDDDGPTLMDDSMNTEEPKNADPAQQDQGNPFKDTSLLQHYAISATNLANFGKLAQCRDSTTLKEINNTTSDAAITKAQQGMATSQQHEVTRCSREEEQESSPVDPDDVVSQDDKDIFALVTGDQTIPAEQQSPWAPLYVVDESDQLNSGNEERMKDRPGESKVQATAMLLNFPAPVHFSPIIRSSQQSPWAREVVESATMTKLDEPISIPAGGDVNIASPREFQAPLLLANQERLSLSSSSPALIPITPEESSQIAREQQYIGLAIGTEKGASLPVQNSPRTPIPQISRQSTPDGEVSIRSFSNFNFSSPQWSVYPPDSCASRGIFSNRKSLATRTSTRPSRRVSFAPLPHEGQGSSQPSTKLRAASPPPPTLVGPEEDDIDGQYHRHFDIMNRRLGVCEIPNPRYHQRLLPSSSQRKPESPSVGAMAEAFREADVHLLDNADNVAERIKDDEVETRVEMTDDRPQSPWQHDSQGIDDVAAVMGNLPDFLDAWNVDTEIERNRTEIEETERHEIPSKNDISILQGVGIW